MLMRRITSPVARGLKHMNLEWLRRALCHFFWPPVNPNSFPRLIETPKPSMILAEMVALELLKCDYKVDKGKVQRDNTLGAVREVQETYIIHDKFSMTCHYTRTYRDVRMSMGQDYGHKRWDIEAGGFHFSKDSDEEKIILEALTKSQIIRKQRDEQAKAHERQLKAVKALEAWCETDPKLLKQVECVICDDYPCQIEHSGPCGHDFICVNGDPDCKVCV